VCRDETWAGAKEMGESLFENNNKRGERMKHTTPPTIFAYGLIGSLKDFGHHLCTDQAKLSLL
jgi:hypothetical protein